MNLKMQNTIIESSIFTNEQIAKIQESFEYVNEDKDGNKRLYFDNAGGAFRLKNASEIFKKIDLIPDNSERNNEMASFLQKIEEDGIRDARIIFNATDGAIYPGYTASMLSFDIIRTITENVSGSNMVTTVLEHPSVYDAMTLYADEHNCELRVAEGNAMTGGVDVEAITELIDQDTRLLSVMAASNISGYIFDIEEIVKQAREIKPDIYIMIDAVQHAPHGILDIESLQVDAMNFAPYKYFGVRGFAVAYLSDRVAEMTHHRLLASGKNNWTLGSPAPAHYAALTEIVNYVIWLGNNFNDEIIAESFTERRRLFIKGMEKIHLYERELLEYLLDGDENTQGLREIEGVTVEIDNPNIEERDLILGVSFANIDTKQAVSEYAKRGVVVYERVTSSLYSKRMLEAFEIEGLVRVSPLHCNRLEDMKEFLEITQKIAQL